MVGVTHLLVLTQVTYSMSLPLWLQIEDVCGDLYPDAEERASILNAIQTYTGALNIGNLQKTGEVAHMNNWVGGHPYYKRHKGCAIRPSSARPRHTVHHQLSPAPLCRVQCRVASIE